MQSNSQVPNINYSVANGGNSSGPFITILKTVDPNSNDIQYSVKQRWLNTTFPREWILTGFTSNSGVTTANWILISDVDNLVQIGLPAPSGSGGPVSPNGSGLIDFTSTDTSITFIGSTNAVDFGITGFAQGDFSSLISIQGTINPGAPTYTSRIGRYQKIGRIATVQYLVSWDSIGGATGNLQCNGLPFTSVNISGWEANFLWAAVNIATAPGVGLTPVGVLAENATIWLPATMDQATGGIAPIAIPATGGVSATIIYETA